MTVQVDIQTLTPTSIIELFEIDATSIGGTIYRFHAGKNSLINDIVWNGVTYSAFPIEASGFEWNGKGSLPRPRVLVSNVLGTITALVLAYQDLVGCKFTRIRTLAKYLDAVNFPDGQNNGPTITATGGTNGTKVNSSGVITASSAPRFDYDPVTFAPLGLLVEEARTNLMLASHTGAGWTSNGGDTVTVNALLAPDGTTSATKIEVASGTTNLRNKSCTITANSTVSASIFVKAGSGGAYQAVIASGASGSCVAWLNTATGAMTGLSTTGSYTAGSAKAVQYANGWWRVIITVTTATDTSLTLETDQATASGNYTSAVGHYFYSWGGQVETGTWASTYIPTTSGTVTRTKDTPTLTTVTWMNSTIGTFVVSMNLFAPGGVLNPGMGFNNTSRSLGVYFDNKGYAGVIFTGDSSTVNTTTRPGVSTLAVGYSATYASRLSLNGGAVAVGTNNFTASTTSIQFGHTAGYTLNGHLKSVKYYPTLRTDAELQTLASGGTVDTIPEFELNLLTPSLVSKVRGPYNPTADPTAEFARDVFYVDRKASETEDLVEFELAASLDLAGVALPRRQVIQNYCPWLYRGAECGYTGVVYFDTNDASVGSLGLDVCGKRLSSCRARFGANAELPYGGFPAAGLMRI